MVDLLTMVGFATILGLQTFTLALLMTIGVVLISKRK